MAYVLKTNTLFGVSSNLKDKTTDRQRRVLRAKPRLYLTPEPDFIAQNSAGKLERWYDSVGQGFYRPGGSVAPAVVDEANGLRSIRFTGGSQQFLVDGIVGAQRIPSMGVPTTIVALVHQTSAAGSFGGGIIAGDIPVFGGEYPMAMFVGATDGYPSIQPRITQPGAPGLLIQPAINNNQWSLITFCLKRNSNGGRSYLNGQLDQDFAENYEIVDDPRNYTPLIGAYGGTQGATCLNGKLAALAIFETYPSDSQGAVLLNDIHQEFMAYKNLLG